MYHYTNEQLQTFIKENISNVKKTMIFSELKRGVLPYILFKLATLFLPIPTMAKTDGLKAIKRSFKKNELQTILSRAQNDTISYNILSIPYFRFLIQIQRA